MMPGDANAQDRRNSLRAAGSVVRTRVSVRKIESATPFESARSVHTIFTEAGSRDAAVLQRP